MEEVQGLDDTVRGSRGFGSTGVSERKDTGEKNETNEQNERTGEKKESMDKNEILKGSSRTRTDRSRKTTEGTSRLSHKR